MKALMQSLYMNAHSDNWKNTLSLLEPNPSAKILDLGCDDGVPSKSMADHIGTAQIHGVEVVEERAELARKKGIEVSIADLEKKWPYPDSSFDVVHSSFVIEHVSWIDHFVAEAFRILKPGGYTVMSTENGSSWHNIFAAVLGWQTFSSSCSSTKVKGLGNPMALHRGQGQSQPSHTHKIIFNYRGYREIFEVHGFQNVKIKGAGYYPLPSFFGALDPRHAHFMALRADKPK